jgi:hypothetical protein
MISFWTNDPSILFNKDYIFELWPTSTMCYEQKLNAITRLIILISLLGYIFTFSIRILIAGFVTLLVIFLFFQMRKQKITHQILEEGFTVEGDKVYDLYEKKKNYNNSRVILNPVTMESAVSEEFKEGNKKNPFSNVLLTQIMDEPDRKAAPPSFNPYIEEDITKNIKKSVQYLNPGIKNTNKQLFGDLYERFELDNANRPFFSTANTRVANDQGAFGKFLYGDMPSSKLSDAESGIERIKDSFRYLLY